MVDLVAIHLSPSASLQRASLFLALSGSLAESGEPLWTRPHTAVIRLSWRPWNDRWIIRWIIRCTSPRFEHCKENRADRATSEVHQDALRVSSLSKPTFANHIEPY